VGGPSVYLELSQAPVQSACRKAREVDKEIEKGHGERIAEGVRREATRGGVSTPSKNDNWNMQLRLDARDRNFVLYTVLHRFFYSSQLLLHLPPTLRSFFDVSLWDLSSPKEKVRYYWTIIKASLIQCKFVEMNQRGDGIFLHHEENCIRARGIYVIRGIEGRNAMFVYLFTVIYNRGNNSLAALRFASLSRRNVRRRPQWNTKEDKDNVTVLGWNK